VDTLTLAEATIMLLAVVMVPCAFPGKAASSTERVVQSATSLIL